MLFYVLLILFVLYVVDMGVCAAYCKKKKKMSLVEQKRKSDFLFVEGEVEKLDNFRVGIVWKIKQILNGWMFYRVKRLGKVPFQKYRIFILKHIFQMDIADKVVIYGWDTIRAPWNISIGKGSVIGDRASLDGRNIIRIGENVNISTGISIYTEQHDVNDSFFRSLNSGGAVIIEDRAWISSHTIILPKVHIGEGAVLASGALTAKNLDAYGIYGGVPARKIGERSKDLKYEFDGKYLPFI